MKYNNQNTKIAVIGGGNIGTQFACAFASKGYIVNLHSSKPQLFDKDLEIIDEYGQLTAGRINLVSSDFGEVVRDCNIVFVTHPAFRLKEIADQIYPYVNPDMSIFVVPGTGGAEFAFQKCIRAGAVLAGLQRVPSVARIEKYGKRVRCEGLRNELFLASIPREKAVDFAEFISSIWGIPCNTLPNYLSVTLTPSNPILHTTRLRTLFADYCPGKVYERNPLFYGEWSDDSSELLIACDAELQEMLHMMNGLDLRGVKSLKLHYESNTIQELTAKMRSISSLHNLPSPMIAVDGGWTPDFSSRFFLADFPFGLAIIEEFAMVLGYEAPNIKSTMNWYHQVTGTMKQIDITQYGLHRKDDIYALYHTNP